MGNLSSYIRYEIIKCEITDVIEAGSQVDQLCDAYGSGNNDAFYVGKEQYFLPTSDELLGEIWSDTTCCPTKR